MEETRPFVSWDLVHDFMVDVFVKYGVPEEDARICTDGPVFEAQEVEI